MPPRTLPKALEALEQQPSKGGLSGEVEQSQDERSAEQEDELDLMEADDLDEDEEYSTNSKKAKNAARNKGKGKGKEKMPDQGKLKHFVAMPMDLMAEVCTYLDPLDLLHLSRSSRQFRSVFLKPSSAPLWRAARRNVDLPDLEIPMAEPSYASLMMEKFCMRCDSDKSTSLKTDYYLRRRFCGNCARKQFIGLDTVKAVGQISSGIVRQCFVSTPRNPLNGMSSSDTRFTLTETIPAVLEKLKILSKETFASMLEGKGSGSTSLSEYLDACKASTISRDRDGEDLHDWADERALEAEEKKDREDEGKCEARQKALEEKFKLEGWDPLEFEADEWLEHELVYCKTKLTPQNWKKVKPELEELLDDLLTDRLAKQAGDRFECRLDRLVDLYGELKASLPAGDASRRHIFPEVNLFLNWKTVSPLFEEDEELTDERWRAALPAIEADLTAYRYVVIDEIFCLSTLALGRAKYAEFGCNGSLTREVLKAQADLDSRVKDLSTLGHLEFLTSFAPLFPIDCGGCHLSGAFPSFLGHPCGRDLHEHLDLIEVLNVDSKKVAALLILADLAGVEKADEAKDLADRLDRMGTVLACGVCVQTQGSRSEVGKRRFDWRSMVDHATSVHPFNPASISIRLASSIEKEVDLDLTLSSDGDVEKASEEEVKAEDLDLTDSTWRKKSPSTLTFLPRFHASSPSSSSHLSYLGSASTHRWAASPMKDWQIVKLAMPKASRRSTGALAARWRTLMARKDEEGAPDAPWTPCDDGSLLSAFDETKKFGGRIDWQRVLRQLEVGRTASMAKKRLEELKRGRRRRLKEEEDDAKVSAARAAVAQVTAASIKQKPRSSISHNLREKPQRRATYTFLSRSNSPLTEIEDLQAEEQHDEDEVVVIKVEKGKGQVSAGDLGPSTQLSRMRQAAQAFEAEFHASMKRFAATMGQQAEEESG
ncbi:hypothetical protein JCM11251_001842 [Rhodosporidiobolus azoricus]